MSLSGGSKCIDRLGRLTECHSLLGPPVYQGVSAMGDKVYWGSIYLGEVDPLTNTVVRTVLDRTTRTLTKVSVTAQLQPNFEPVDIIGDLVVSRVSGRILGRKLGDKLI